MTKFKDHPHDHYNMENEAFPSNPYDWCVDGVVHGDVSGFYPVVANISWSSLGAVRICCVLPRTEGRELKFVIECFENKKDRRANVYLHAEKDILSDLADKKVQVFRMGSAATHDKH